MKTRIKTGAALAVLCGVLFTAGCRERVDLITGTNSVVWANRPFGDTKCGDGNRRTVTLGFREDGVVVWRVDW